MRPPKSSRSTKRKKKYTGASAMYRLARRAVPDDEEEFGSEVSGGSFRSLGRLKPDVSDADSVGSSDEAERYSDEAERYFSDEAERYFSDEAERYEVHANDSYEDDMDLDVDLSRSI
jgi:hypothetical protein